MASSHVEEVVEQVRGRDLDPPAKGRGKKDKSRDLLTSLDGRVTRLEVAMADTKEGMDLVTPPTRHRVSSEGSIFFFFFHVYTLS